MTPSPGTSLRSARNAVHKPRKRELPAGLFTIRSRMQGNVPTRTMLIEAVTSMDHARHVTVKVVISESMYQMCAIEGGS